MPDHGTLEAIYVAAAAGDLPVAVEAAEVTAAGLAGDRYEAGVGTFSHRLPDGRAVTLIAAETLDDLGERLADGRHRRNLVVRGVDLDALLRRTFTVGGVVLRGARPCPPCGRLARLTDPEAKRLLHRRGGLRADVVTPGTIRVGDAVIPGPA